MFSFRLDEFFLLIALLIYLQRALGVSSQPHFWCILKVHLCSAWGSGADNSKLLLPGDGECALQPGPKICPCFIAWVCVQGNSRCVPIQLRHSSCSEDENVGIVSWTPSCLITLDLSQSFEADPPQPLLPSLCVIRWKGSFSPQTPANHQGLGGM